MIWQFIGRKIFYSLAILLGLSLWMLTTQSGLNFSFLILKQMVPGTLSAENITGSFVNPIKIEALRFESSTLTFTINELVLDADLATLRENHLKINDFSAKNAEFRFNKKEIKPILINELQGNTILSYTGTPLSLQIKKIEGSWSNLPMQGHINVNILDPNQHKPDISLTLGENQLTVVESTQDSALVDWLINIENFEPLNLMMQGYFKFDDQNKEWDGKIAKAKFISPYAGTWELKEASDLQISKKGIMMNTLQLQQSADTFAKASFIWNQAGLAAKLEIPSLPLQHPYIQGKVGLFLEIQQKPNQIPFVDAYCILYPGSISSPLLKAQYRQFAYRGGAATLKLNADGLITQFSLKENAENAVRGVIKSDPAVSLKDFLDEPLQGSLTAQWNDLSLLYAFIPQISKLKATIGLNGQFKGTWGHPSLQLDAKTEKASFFVTKQSVKVTDFTFHVTGDIPGKLNIIGSAKDGEGQLQFSGNAELNEELKTLLRINGKGIDIYDTTNIHIIASPEITVNYINGLLYVEGTVVIPKADIFLENERNYAMLSKDILFVDHEKNFQNLRPFRIVPSLYLLIENNLHFKGYGIDGIIGGKLAIDQRPDGLLSGNGRLTIKEGKYRLQGATRYIHRGYLLFPAGTLLTDPILDIRILQKRLSAEQNGDVGIYVQGTLQKPIYQPYSNSNLQSSEVLSRLGFGGFETSGDENQKQLLAQTAYLLAGNANPFIDFLQTNLGLDEFNLEAKETTYKSFYTQGGTDTVLIIGKSLTPKIYLQYLQSVLEPISTIRLKYFLGPYFTTSIETGTEGSGGDLTFSMERD